MIEQMQQEDERLLMKTAMSTRNPGNVKDFENTTDFVLHKSQQTKFNGIQKKIVDFTEHKLMKYAEVITDPQQKLVVMAMISDYRNGFIAVAWKKGSPIYIRVTKNG